MSPLSTLPILPLFALALCTLWVLDRYAPLQLPQSKRISSIDGLRGYLAFGVFLHHSSIWYLYLRTGQWTEPTSAIYTQLGQASVSLFFMITGFLFTAKLLATPAQHMDWIRLYVSRVLRITPLWLAVKVIVVLLALLVRHWNLDAANPSWLPSTASTGLMTAGVTWTLYFEWTFYLLLPWLALALRRRPPLLWLVLSVAMVFLLSWNRVITFYSYTFLCGIAAAWLVRVQPIQSFARSVWGSMAVIALLAVVYTVFGTAYSYLPTSLLAVAFVLIAAGNTLFGLLSWRLSRVFGEITFSVYLLHGMVLYVAYRLIIGLHTASSLSMTAHWLVAAAATPCLIALSYLSFKYIEMPAMRQTNACTAWLNKWLSRKNRGNTTH